MNRRNFLKSSAALTVCSTVLNTRALASSLLAAVPANVYDRPLHIVYADSGGPSLAETDDVLLAAWDQVPGGITAMSPFLLNVKNPSKYESMINAVQARGTIITPGVGQSASNGPLYTPTNQAIALAYSAYSNYIRLENTQGFYQNPGGQADIQNMIDYCVNTCGFQHIMLNPWPMDSNGNVVPFANPELDASFNQVMLDFDHQPPYTVTPNPNNWLVNQNVVGLIQAYRPSCQIVVNYESAPQHEALYYMELNNPGSSIPAMDITATQCENSPNGLHWCPPFTQIYDPVALGTWPWMANRLGDMPGDIDTPGSVDLQTSMALVSTSTGYTGTVTVANKGTAVAVGVVINSAMLGSAASDTLPAGLGDLQPGTSASITLTFTASAGADHTATSAHIAGTYSGGTFGSTLRTTLP